MKSLYAFKGQSGANPAANLFLLLLTFFICVNPCLALDYYWVNGSGNWSDHNTHWAMSSGGAVFHDQVPTSMDNVHFDANSGFTAGNNTVTIDQTVAYCLDMNWTGAANTPVLTGPGDKQVWIYGSLVLISAMSWDVHGEVNFRAFQAGKTIFTSGNTFINSVRFDGSGGTWTLLDKFTCQSYMQFLNGTLMTNDQEVEVIYFTSDGTGVRNLILGDTDFHISDGAFYAGYSSTNLTVDPGTSNIILESSGGQFYGGQQNWYDVTFVHNGSGGNNYFFSGNVLNKLSCGNFIRINQNQSGNTIHEAELLANANINGNNTFDILSLTPGMVYELQTGKTQTITPGGTLNADGLNCSSFIILKSSDFGSLTTISKAGAAVIANYIILADIEAVGGASFTATNSVNLWNNPGWTIIPVTSRNLYWVGDGGQWSDSGHWSLSSGGPGGECIPNAYDNVFFDANSFPSGGTVSIDVQEAFCNSMQWSGVVNTPQVTGNGNNSKLFIFGSLQLQAAMSWAYNGEARFMGSTTGKTITMAGQALQHNCYFDGPGSEWTFMDKFTALGFMNFVKGTIITNDQEVEVIYFSSDGTGVRNLILGDTDFHISDGAFYAGYSSTNLTVDPGTSNIILESSGGQFYGGQQNWYDVTFVHNGSGGNNYFFSGNVLNKLSCGNFIRINENQSGNTIHEAELLANANINGNNTFDILSFTPGKTYIFAANTTQTITPLGNFIAEGYGGFPIEIKSDNLGSQATLHKDGDPICLDFLYLTDMAATGSGFSYAGANSDNVFNNTGWIFDACPACFNTPPASAPTLDPISITQISPGTQASLILQDLPVGYEALWFNEDQSQELYADANNHFQPVLNESTVLYAAIRELSTGCVSAVLAVQICAPPVLVSSNTPICAGTSDLLLTEIGGVAESWSWTGVDGFTSAEQNPVIPYPNSANSGNYTVVINDIYGCTNSRTISVTIYDPPQIPAALDPSSTTIVQQNDQATLMLAGLQPGQTAVWYAEDQSTVLYNDAANNFQPVVNQSATYYAAVQNTGNGCSSPLLAVPVFSYPALSLQTSYSFTCSNSATGVATVYARGGAQSIGQGNFVVTDEWMSIFGPETALIAETGDLNGDGYPDVLTYDAGSPDIWLNDGDGTFTNGFQNFLIDISTQCVGFIKLGDFDGDGDLDALRLVCEGLRIWWNDGTAHFSPDATVYQPNYLGPSHADVGDVDMDGDLDFIIQNLSGIQVFYNNGSGNFTMGGETYVNGGISYVYLRDFDNDGYPDILAVSLSAAHPMRVLLNDGDGTFTLNGSYGTGNRSQADFGHFNADDYLDFVVKGHLTTPAKVFLNDGDGSFTEQAADYGGTGNGGVKVGDFNKDGMADFILSRAIAPNNYPATYFGNGDGTFTLHENFLDIFINSGPVAGIALADYDTDGDLDIYGGNKIYKNDQSRVDPYDYAWSSGHTTPSASNLAPGTYTVTVTDNAGQTASATVVVNAPPDVLAQVSATPVSCTNAKNGTASALGSGGAPFIFRPVDESYATYWAGSQVIRLGHFNVDGYLDILSVGGGPGNGNYPYVTDHLFFGDGDGTFTESLPAFDEFDTTFGEPADLDGDGDMDILNSGYLRIFGRFNDGAGNFSSGPGFNFPIGNIVGQAWHIGPTGDFDGDGDQDIFAFGFNYMVHVVLLNNGDGTFTQSPTIYGLEMIRRVAVGDLDGDGYDDIFIPGYGLPCFVYQSNGDGTFTQMPQTYGGQQMWGDVDLADLDGDGDLDAFVASFGNIGPQNGPGNLIPSLYKVFLNNGDATFTEHATILEEVYSTELITLGDADGDGDIDAFSGGRQSFGIVWLNDGNANFSKYPFKTAGGWHWDARWGDLDNDGDQDLVVGDGTVKVLLNQENCYTYKWNTGATTADITGLNPGNYTVTVTDYGGCTVVETVAVGNANYQPPIAAISNSPLYTGTDDLQLSESGGAQGVTWAWSGPDGFQSADQNPVIVNPSPANSGNYTVVVTDANGCTNAADATVVVSILTISCPNDVLLTLGPGACSGIVNTLEPIVTSGAGGDNVQQTSGLPSGSEFPIGVTTNCFLATDALNNTAVCCFDVTVEEYPNPIQSLVCNDMLPIFLDETCQYVVTVDTVLEGGPYGCFNNYLIDIDKTAPYGNGPWVPAVVGAADIGMTYQVRVTDPTNGNKCWGNIYVQDVLPPVVVCQNIAINCGEPPHVPPLVTDCSAYTLSWTDQVVQNAPPAEPYQVIAREWMATDAGGYTAVCTQTITIQYPQPHATITNDMDMACPFTTNNHYEAQAGMDSYAWVVTGNGTPTTPLNSQAIEVTAGASGSYTVALTVYKNGCSATYSKMIHIDMAGFAITGSDFCPSDSGPTIGLNGSDMGVTYQLETGNGDKLGTPVMGTGNPIYFGMYPNGAYKVVVMANYCTHTITGTVNAQPGVCDIDAPGFCSCNAPEGRAPVTIKINAPEGQNWTVKAVVGLYDAGSPPAPGALTPLAIGTPLVYIGGNMYDLNALRRTDKGYWIQLTNGVTDKDLMVGVAGW